ncbi:MAG: LysR family transcriptional regulator [Sphingomonadaceae bacterium]
MNKLPEWTDLRYFLELARAGTLTGAARRLAVDHTTVARRIQRLEVEFGTPLFDHRREGYELTEQGRSLVPHAELMESAAMSALEQLAGKMQGARGVVRLGAPELLGSLIIAPQVPGLINSNPELFLDLLLLPRFANLANREADLSITLDPPETGRYMITRLTCFRYYLYGSRSYLDRHPAILRKEDLAEHLFIDYVQTQLMSTGLNYLDEMGIVPKRRFCATGMLAQCEAANAGIGLVMAPPYAANRYPDLVPVLPEMVFAHRTLWLVAPSDLYGLQRVRTVWDWLRATVEGQKDQLFLPPADPVHTAA